MRQHGHVLDQVVLGRVHLLDVAILHCQSLWVRERFTTKAGAAAACRETVTYPPVSGFHYDFVTFELLDFNLDVGFFFIGNPGSFLA